ncbi:M48 family metalloprotease [Neptuniibacter sp. QD37_11]|uniref:M48 family metalloprotease n=1 Tax=Neptuniibacter sp. QD37_11 TaxID=3398209 RepID=UPI0039F5158A
MNFRQHQDKAKKNTSHLMKLFTMMVLIASSVLGAISATALIYQLESMASLKPELLRDIIYVQQFWLIFASCSGIIALIFFCSYFISKRSNKDGHRVALAMGGIAEKDIKDNKELGLAYQQLKNIVEEISLAAAIKPPSLYIIDDDAINAFAAGAEEGGYVIGVTVGAMDAFNREQMSGVIAHEVGHIVNRDVNLNVKIAACVTTFSGLYILGRIAIEPYGDRKHPAVMIIGLALVIVGLLTQFMGSIIQAATSRQREYLADASAVQFTRYPDGIKEALEIINGSREPNTQLSSAKAGGYSHAFIFGFKQKSLMSTHPPTEDRIKRLSGLIKKKAKQVKPKKAAW